MSDTRTTLTERIDSLLLDRFGLTGCYPYQQLVILNILEQEGPDDQLVLLPTGYGKSLCFMLPGLLLEGITLIVYPLLSLMNDQNRRFEALGAAVFQLRGGQSPADRRALFTSMRQAGRAFVLTTPETLEHPRVQQELSSLCISHIVIDEAHIVSAWGRSFRPAYARLGAIVQTIPHQKCTAFTATASAQTVTDIRDLLFLGKPVHIVQGDADRPNIFYKVIPSISKERDLHCLFTHPCIRRPILVFCGRRDTTEQLAMIFRVRLGSQQICHYHAGLSSRERALKEQWFTASQDGILFATTAFGLGVDKSDIRTVIHYRPASDIEAFLQESGRAGRDRQSALSVTLFYRSELQDQRTDSRIREYLRDTSCCRRTALLAAFGQQVSSCFGCDVCDRSVLEGPDGQREILQLIRAYPHRFTAGDAARILYGRASRVMITRRRTACRGFGSLRSWELDDIQQAVVQLIGEEEVGEDASGRLFPADRRKSLPSRAAALLIGAGAVCRRSVHGLLRPPGRSPEV
jgi:ATP-dependent DNA helicase RecQ